MEIITITQERDMESLATLEEDWHTKDNLKMVYLTEKVSFQVKITPNSQVPG